MQLKILLIVLLINLASSAQASLFVRPGGMVYDSDQNLTWLQDANYAKTSGYTTTDDTGFGVGAMNWAEANKWANNLSYGGHDDWRLPAVTYHFGPGGVENYDVIIDTSEGTNMLIGVLENQPARGAYGLIASDILPSPLNSGPFINLDHDTGILDIPTGFWSSSYFLEAGSYPIGFSFASGNSWDCGAYHCYAWAVRDGDVSAVPVPAALWLFGSGLIGLIGLKYRRTN